MKILSDKTVFEAALERIGFLFDEFPNVVVGISGGKDSTVVYHLALRIARERGRLPLTVFFLDQEAEWTATVDYVRSIMHSPEVRPMWMQMPMHLDNAASFTTRYLKCWDPERPAEWVHPKDPLSLKENIYGTNRFKELFPAIFRKHYGGEPLAVISGVRCEESPGRLMGLTHGVTYKWVTWGKKLTPGHYTFYPIYDWSYTFMFQSWCDYRDFLIAVAAAQEIAPAVLEEDPRSFRWFETHLEGNDGGGKEKLMTGSHESPETLVRARSQLDRGLLVDELAVKYITLNPVA